MLPQKTTMPSEQLKGKLNCCMYFVVLLLTPCREAERCVKILENLSLRGNFWPGACATALNDLQKSLGNKLFESSSTDGPTGSGLGEAHGPHSSSQATNGKNPGTKLVEGEQQNPSSALQHPQSQMTEPREAPQADRDVQMNSSENRSSFQPGEAPQNWSTNFESLPELVGPLDLFGDQFDGVGDIFELLDASYQFSEQMF